MIEQELISVIMPAFNAEKYIRTAINSILSQTYTNFEFLICDDASTDGTLEIINEFHDARIKIIRHTVNKGIVSTLNELIELSSGSLIARMDADDISLPSRLEKQAEYLRQNPVVGCMGCCYAILNSEKRYSIQPVPLHDPEIKAFLSFQSPFAHGSVMFVKMIANIRYSEKYKLAEDYALWFKLSNNTKFANYPECLYIWRDSDYNVSKINSDQSHNMTTKIKKEFEGQKYLQEFSEKERIFKYIISNFKNYSVTLYKKTYKVNMKRIGFRLLIEMSKMYLFKKKFLLSIKYGLFAVFYSPISIIEYIIRIKFR